jgi:ribulose-phosphate 3-epimerase
MAEIVPAINDYSFKEVKEKIVLTEGQVNLIQLDVADGTFTPRAVWNNPNDLRNIKTTAKIEIHFMVENPEDKVAPWLDTQIGRIIFHIESTTRASALINSIRAAGKEVGIAVRPDTTWDVLMPYKDAVDLFLVLAVPPGASGQQFNSSSFEKISRLHINAPNIAIEVDGGVNIDNAKECVEKGAKYLVAGSALFNTRSNFLDSLNELKKAIE